MVYNDMLHERYGITGDVDDYMQVRRAKNNLLHGYQEVLRAEDSRHHATRTIWYHWGCGCQVKSAIFSLLHGS